MVVEIAHLNQDFLVQAVPEGFPCIGWCLVNNMHTHRCLRNPCCQHEEPLCSQHCVCWWAQHIATHWPSLMASVWLCAGTLMINFLLFHLKVKLHYYDYTLECHYNAVQYIHDITYSNAMTAVEHKSDFEFTKDTCCDDFGENLSYIQQALCWVTLDKHWLVHMMMFADVLVPNRCHAISTTTLKTMSWVSHKICYALYRFTLRPKHKPGLRKIRQVHDPLVSSTIGLVAWLWQQSVWTLELIVPA